MRVSADSGNDQSALWITLIVIGAIICAAIIVAVGILLHRSVSYRKQAKELDQLQR